jgi:hypothetical protein
MAVYGSLLLEAAGIVHIVMISEQLQQMEVFLFIVGCGARGWELRFHCLKPPTWIFSKIGRHDVYGYVCLGDGGDHHRASWRGGGC